MAVDLFEEGDWAGCRRECLRVEASDRPDPMASLLGAVCALRLKGPSDSASRAVLSALAESAEESAIRAMAAYELGRALWADGDPASAFPLLAQAFRSAPTRDLFIAAGCSLRALMRRHPDIAAGDAGLRLQIEAARGAWNRRIEAQYDLEAGAGWGGWLALPGRWIVGFYRAQIRPAIGSRCSMQPSCSEYFLEACRRHGLLGFALYADRGVREPGVVAAAERPVVSGDTVLYEDPLEDHDWWLKR